MAGGGGGGGAEAVVVVKAGLNTVGVRDGRIGGTRAFEMGVTLPIASELSQTSSPVSLPTPMGGGGRWTIDLPAWLALRFESVSVGPAVIFVPVGESISSVVEVLANGNSLDSTAAMAVAFKRAKPLASEPRLAINLILSLLESAGEVLLTSTPAETSSPDGSTTELSLAAAATAAMAVAAALAASVAEVSMDDRRSKRPLAAAILSFKVRARPFPVVALDDAAETGGLAVGVLSTETTPGVGHSTLVQARKKGCNMFKSINKRYQQSRCAHTRT